MTKTQQANAAGQTYAIVGCEEAGVCGLQTQNKPTKSRVDFLKSYNDNPVT
jgi:hypothetical protein